MNDGWGIFLSCVGTIGVILLTIIGYLINKGVDKILSEIRLIWEWITKDTDKTEKFNTEVTRQIAEINTRCGERHPIYPGGRRDYDPLVRATGMTSDEK